MLTINLIKNNVTNVISSVLLINGMAYHFPKQLRYKGMSCIAKAYIKGQLRLITPNPKLRGAATKLEDTTFTNKQLLQLYKG